MLYTLLWATGVSGAILKTTTTRSKTHHRLSWWYIWATRNLLKKIDHVMLMVYGSLVGCVIMFVKDFMLFLQQFVAHPSCQKKLTTLWYADFQTHLKNKSWCTWISMMFAICFFYPLWALIYLIAPASSVSSFWVILMAKAFPVTPAPFYLPPTAAESRIMSGFANGKHKGSIKIDTIGHPVLMPLVC